MTDFHAFKGAAKRLDNIDLPRIGHQIGVGEDELHAFMDIESSGSGFDSQGRPKMLFEPHLFYRELSTRPDLRSKAIVAGLAYLKQGAKSYPTDSYPRITQAIALAGEEAALRSASWGATQILGSNCELCGYSTPQEMVLAFMADEENQLQATVKLITAMGIADDVKQHNWRIISLHWNGSASPPSYATRMAARFKWWQGIKDTPWTPGQTIPTTTKPTQKPVQPVSMPPLAPLPPRPPAAPPLPLTPPAHQQLGIGAVVLLALAGVGSLFSGLAGYWPWLLGGAIVLGVLAMFFWNRAHTKGS